MNLLVIDTSTEACAVGVSAGDRHFGRFELTPRRHTDCVLPWSEQLLADAGLTKSDLQAIGVEGKRVDDEMFFGFTSKFAFVTDRAVKVIDRLFEGAGSSAIADFNPMQRYWRDGHAARLHTGSDYDTMLQNYGRSIMGLMPTPDL